MTIPVWVLLLFAAWTSSPNGTIGYFRWSRNSPARDDPGVAAGRSPGNGLVQARHARSCELPRTLPIYTAVVIALLVTGAQARGWIS